MRLFAKFCLVFVLLVGCSGLVMAEPIRIPSGNISLTATDFNSGDNSSGIFVYTFVGLRGDNFSIGLSSPVGSGYGVDGLNTIFNQAFQIGDSINGNLPFNTLYPSENYLVGQVFNPPSSSASPTVGNLVNFNPITSNFTLSSTLPVTIPFSMTGRITYCGNPLPSCPASVDFNNNGNVTYRFVNNAVGQPTTGYRIQSVVYSFSTPTPEPTPEPTTILLFGTGIVGVIGYARRKRKSNKITS